MARLTTSGRPGIRLPTDLKALSWVGIAAIMLLTVTCGITSKRPSSDAPAAVNGTSYKICEGAGSFLTSPWTYHSLASGSQDYTVSQYQALPGYGKALPPLPPYISGMGANAPAATIYAPGANARLSSYDVPVTPRLHFFEGGSYGVLDIAVTNGSVIIGGSTSGFPEPTFNNGGRAAGISAQNDSYAYPSNPTPISRVASPAARGATTVTLTSSTVPVMPWANIVIGSKAYDVGAVSGTQSGGYTLTVVGGLDIAAAAGAPVYYGKLAGAVTVSYLDISHDLHNTTGTIYTGSGWTVSHNNVHDFYNSMPGLGIGLYGGAEGVVEYNCFSKMGVYAVNIFGHNNKFRRNEVRESNYMPDPGCGCSGGGKWWGTLNADITDNTWVDNSPGGSSVIWLDNGNSGTLISGNHFSRSSSSAIHSETGFNVNIVNNTFQDGGWGSGSGCGDTNCVGAVNLNSSGGFHVPGSRYDNQIVVSNNQFINNWGGISIWQSGSRSCLNSGEDWPNDAAYCSGGFPITAESTAGGSYYFSHSGNSANQGGGSVTAAASAGSRTLQISGAAAINDYVGFSDPAKTKTRTRSDVARLNGSSIINAASTARFPSAGQLRVGTSAAWGDAGGSYTGAILSYTGRTATTFTGVRLVRGSGTLAGPVIQVQPYKVTTQRCYSNDCLLTISPALASAVSAGSSLTNAGTCQLYATSAATPAGPLAPDGTSYFDGCQWGTKNISIRGNTMVFDPAHIATHAPLSGGGSTTTCTAGHANACGTNFMAYQESGEPPFNTLIGANAMMSNSGLITCPTWDPGCTVSPLKNINALSNPPGAPAANNEPSENIVWSNNTYSGPWQWNVYSYGGCGTLPSDASTGKIMPAGSCSVDFGRWRSAWQQDVGSTYSAGPAPTTQAASTPSPTRASHHGARVRTRLLAVTRSQGRWVVGM